MRASATKSVTRPGLGLQVHKAKANSMQATCSCGSFGRFARALPFSGQTLGKLETFKYLSCDLSEQNSLGTLQCRPSAQKELDHRQHHQEKIKPEEGSRLSDFLLHLSRSACSLFPLSSKKDTPTPMILMHTCRSG